MENSKLLNRVDYDAAEAITCLRVRELQCEVVRTQRLLRYSPTEFV